MKTSNQRAAEIFAQNPLHEWVIIFKHPDTDKILMAKKYKKMPSMEMNHVLCEKLEAVHGLEEFSINTDTWMREYAPNNVIKFTLR